MKRKKTKRNRLGHFVKANPRKRSAKKKRTATKRTAARRQMRKSAPRKISKRLKRASSGRFQKRRRHKVRSHARKTRTGKTARVKSHYSFEESPKPRRRRKRARAREEVVQVKKKSPRRKRKSSRRAKRNPRLSASIPAVTRRRRGRKTVTRPATVRVVLSDRRRSTKRRAKRRSPKRTHKKRKTAHRRRRSPRYTPASHQLGPATVGMEGYALENPLSAGEMGLAFVTGGIGYVSASLLDRYLATRAGTAATGGAGAGNGTLSDAAAIAAAPGIMRILSQAGLAAAFVIPAHFVSSPMGRAALQGAGLGVGVRLLGQLAEYFIVQKFFGLDSSGNATAFGSRFYPSEINATAIAAQVAASATAPGQLTVSGQPRMLRQGVQGNCAPCSSQSYNGAMQQAYRAAKAESNDCAQPCGPGERAPGTPQWNCGPDGAPIGGPALPMQPPASTPITSTLTGVPGRGMFNSFPED